MLSKHTNGLWSSYMVVKSDLLLPIHTQSHQLPFQKFWSVCVIHKLPVATPTMPAVNLKWHINFYFNVNHLPVSTSDNSLSLPHPSFPFTLAAPANTLVSLRLQLVKATVLGEGSFLYFIISPGSLCYCDLYRHESGGCRTLPFVLTFFIITPFQVFLL
jgi:hypothetical protein